MKVAFTGSSGSGKTTLVKYVEDQFGLKHISSSAGDLFTEEDRKILSKHYKYYGEGHSAVIRKSATNAGFAVAFQEAVQLRRAQAIYKNKNFVTDRSPVDNLTYYVNQCGMHKEVYDARVESFINQCVRAWKELTHVIYIKAVQPDKVEDNGSRVDNKYYQQAVDAQFQHWLVSVFLKHVGPKVLMIDYWDLDKRKKDIKKFLKQK